MDAAHKIEISSASTRQVRDDAGRRHADARRQLDVLLASSENNRNSDFYTYRYLASAGFLPGYNFPRLPLMAWIPSRGKITPDKDDPGAMISRPRFLGISEFGPRSLIYHEGRMFRVIKAKIHAGANQVSTGARLTTQTAVICPVCGHGHKGGVVLQERCELCNTPLTVSNRIDELYKIETVETRAVERISINDEERQRIGYELQTMYRVNKNDIEEAEIDSKGKTIGSLMYSPSALLWRINLGWKRRKYKEIKGFSINPLSGLWSKDEDDESDRDADEDAIQSGVHVQRIVPYVEDYKNILILKLSESLPAGSAMEIMATLQAALKRGIERYYEIEEVEIAAEPLPSGDERTSILFYEASEGGAGVLNRITGDPGELKKIAKQALEIMHYDTSKIIKVTSDLEDTKKDCVAGCYRCLLSYYNQPEHKLINRRNHKVKEILVSFLNGTVAAKPKKSAPVADNGTLAQFLKEKGFKDPDQLNYSIMNGLCKADAYYQAEKIVLFIKSPGKEVETYVADRGFQLVLLGENVTGWQEILDKGGVPGR
jgi:hypothetical protein